MPIINRLLRATLTKETRRVELVSSRNKTWRHYGHELQRDVAPFHNRKNMQLSYFQLHSHVRTRGNTLAVAPRFTLGEGFSPGAVATVFPAPLPPPGVTLWKQQPKRHDEKNDRRSQTILKSTVTNLWKHSSEYALSPFPRSSHTVQIIPKTVQQANPCDTLTTIRYV